MTSRQLLLGIGLIVLVLSTLSGCGSRLGEDSTKTSLEPTSYQPMAPLCIEVDSAAVTEAELLQNEAGRFGLQQITATGNLNVAGSEAKASHSAARVISDYIVYRTHPLMVVITQKYEVDDDQQNTKDDQRKRRVVNVYGPDEEVPSGESVKYRGAIPVYIGIGVRIEAQVTNISGDVNLANLPAVGAAASANRLQGTITVGTLGISADSMGLLIQQPVALNDTSVQSALQSVGAIKASLASTAKSEKVFRLNPQIIGFDSYTSDAHINTAIRRYVASRSYFIGKDRDTDMVRILDGGVGQITVRERSNRGACAAGLRQIGLRFLMWAHEHRGRCPDDLGSLVQGTPPIETQSDLLKLTCASSDTPLLTSHDMADAQSRADWINTHSSYRYLGKGMVLDGSSDSRILLYCPQLHDGRHHVLFGSGEVKSLPPRELEAYLRQPPTVPATQLSGK